jgi:hypothetical protein
LSTKKRGYFGSARLRGVPWPSQNLKKNRNKMSAMTHFVLAMTFFAMTQKTANFSNF